MVFWIYIPLPELAQIETFTVTKYNNLLIRTSSAEAHNVGSANSFLYPSQPNTSFTAPRMLVYDEPDAGRPITRFGIRDDVNNRHTREVQIYTPSTWEIEETHHCHAALENVCQVRVFYTQDTGHCKGLLFSYEDGSQQAVGQCGVSCFPEVTVEFPTVMYIDWDIEESQRLQLRLRFEFDTKSTDGQERELYWDRVEMAGTMKFFYNRRYIVGMYK